MKGYCDVDNDYDIRDTCVIHEVYDTGRAHEIFFDELESALEAGFSMIIIEPVVLGEEIARWINVGNFLHKTAVIFGVGAISSAFIWPSRLFIYVPFAVGSIFCTGLYTLSWQPDPCVKYQVFNDPVRRLAKKEGNKVAVPILLIRKNDDRRKIIHCGVTLAATIFCVWKMYKFFSN